MHSHSVQPPFLCGPTCQRSSPPPVSVGSPHHGPATHVGAANVDPHLVARGRLERLGTLRHVVVVRGKQCSGAVDVVQVFQRGPRDGRAVMRGRTTTHLVHDDLQKCRGHAHAAVDGGQGPARSTARRGPRVRSGGDGGTHQRCRRRVVEDGGRFLHFNLHARSGRPPPLSHPCVSRSPSAMAMTLAPRRGGSLTRNVDRSLTRSSDAPTCALDQPGPRSAIGRTAAR